MFTNNFWKVFGTYLRNGKISGSYSATGKNWDGNTISILGLFTNGSTIYNLAFGLATNTIDPNWSGYYQGIASMLGIYNMGNIYYNNTSAYVSSASQHHTCVMIGDGTAEPTADDYKLSGNIITSFTATTSLSVIEDNGVDLVGMYNITNTGNTPFTIKEVCLCCDNCMLERTVLSSPLTINAGDTKTLVYRISFGGSSTQAL